MKSVHWIIAAMAAFLTTQSLCLAGPGVSGGGAAMVWRDKNHKVTKAQFYDLYAAKDPLLQLKVIESNSSVDKQVEDAVTRWANDSKQIWSDRPSPDVSLLRRALALVNRDWLPLDKGERLPFVPDFKPDFVCSDPDCGAETLAYYDDVKSVLRIDMEIYAKLSPTDQAALKLHEALYKIGRVFDAFNNQTSAPTRALVQKFFTARLDGKSQLADLQLSSGLNAMLGSDNQRGSFTPAQLDLFLGGKTLYCSEVSLSSQFMTFKFERSTDDRTVMALSSGDSDTLAWGSGGDIATLQQLPNPDLKGLDEAWGVFDAGDSEYYNLKFRFEQMLDDDTYLRGKKSPGFYSYWQDGNSAGAISNVPMTCGIQ